MQIQRDAYIVYFTFNTAHKLKKLHPLHYTSCTAMSYHNHQHTSHTWGNHISLFHIGLTNIYHSWHYTHVHTYTHFIHAPFMTTCLQYLLLISQFISGAIFPVHPVTLYIVTQSLSLYSLIPPVIMHCHSDSPPVCTFHCFVSLSGTSTLICMDDKFM